MSKLENQAAQQPTQAAAGSAPVRRSQRLRVAIPVVLSWTNSSALTVRARAETEVISRHGALLKMEVELTPGAEVNLSRPETGRKVRARVVGKGLVGAEGLPRVAVEILTDDASFWGVSFPN